MKWRIRRKGVIANDDSNSNPRDFRQPPSSSLFFPQLGSSSHSNDDRKEDLEENTLEYDQSLEKIDIDPNFGNVSLIPRFVMDPFHAIVIHETEEESVYEVPFELEGDDNDCENAEWEEAVYTDDELTFDDDASDVGSMVGRPPTPSGSEPSSFSFNEHDGSFISDQRPKISEIEFPMEEETQLQSDDTIAPVQTSQESCEGLNVSTSTMDVSPSKQEAGVLPASNPFWQCNSVSHHIYMSEEERARIVEEINGNGKRKRNDESLPFKSRGKTGKEEEEEPDIKILHSSTSVNSFQHHVPYAGDSSSSSKKPTTEPQSRESTGRYLQSALIERDAEGIGTSMRTPSGVLLLSLPDDKFSLSEALCIARENIEVFVATDFDVKFPTPGRKGPVVIGQVGLRCIHCRVAIHPSEKVNRAVCFPSSIERIYRAVIHLKNEHFKLCRFVPVELKMKLEQLKASRGTGISKQYFVQAAKRMGMVDGGHGIRFCKETAASTSGESALLKPLSFEERKRVHEALYGHGPLNEKLAVSWNDSVQRQSMQTLRPGQWLNDEVIHYFFSLLANRDEALSAVTPGRKRSHFFLSFFFTKLFDEKDTNQYSYENVKSWSNSVPGKDIFELDKMIFACNVNGSHWTCAVVFVQKKKIQYFDSMSSSGEKYVDSLFQYLKDEWKAKKGEEMPDLEKWEFVYGHQGDNIPQQHNGYDCGVFTCMFAYFLSVDRSLSFNQTYVNQCRDRIALSILTNDIEKIDDVRNYEEEGKENTDVSNIVMPNVNITAIENHNETSTSIGFHNSENLFPPMPPLVSNIDNNFNSTILNAANVRTIAAQRWLNLSEIEAVLDPNNPTRILDISKTPIASPPTSGQIFLFDRNVTRYYKQDGHQWQKRGESSVVKENRKKLLLRGKLRIGVVYTHSSTCTTFQKRAYHLLDPETESTLSPIAKKSEVQKGLTPASLVLVHYLDTRPAPLMKKDIIKNPTLPDIVNGVISSQNLYGTDNGGSVSVSNGSSNTLGNGRYMRVNGASADMNGGIISSTSISALDKGDSAITNSDSDSSVNDNDTSRSRVVNTGNVIDDIDRSKWQYDIGNSRSHLASTCRCRKCNIIIPLDQKRLFRYETTSMKRQKTIHPYCFDETELFATPKIRPMADEITSDPKTLAIAFAQQYVDTRNWTDEEFQDFIRRLEKGLSNDREVHMDHPSDWRMEPEIKMKIRGVEVPLTGVTRTKVNHENEKDKFICPDCLPGIVRRIGNTDEAKCDNIGCGHEFMICDHCISIHSSSSDLDKHCETEVHIRNVRTGQTNAVPYNCQVYEVDLAFDYKIEDALNTIFDLDMTKKFLGSRSMFDVGATIQHFTDGAKNDITHILNKMKGVYKSGFWWNEKEFDNIHEFGIIVFRIKNVKYRKSDDNLPVDRGERALYYKIVESNEGINVSSLCKLGQGQENHTAEQTDESAKYNYSLYILGCNEKFHGETRLRIRKGYAHSREVEQS